MHNHNFWGRHFRRVFVPHLQRLLDVLEKQFLRWEVLTKRLKARGVVLENLTAWATLDELRTLSNTVKHADGTSAEALRKRFPRYFDDPDAPQGATMYLGTGPRVYRPLSGDDI